jgi:hypothetical protein
MNKSGIIVLGILSILIVVVAASGCTSPNDTDRNSPQSMIVLGNTPTVMQLKPETTNIAGLLQNKADDDYKNVQIEVNGLDQSGNIISSQKTVIATIKANDEADYNVDLPYNAKIVAGDVKVLNATAE